MPTVRGTAKAESRRDRLARTGLIVLGAGRLRPVLRRAPTGRPVGAAVLRALLDERSAGR